MDGLRRSGNQSDWPLPAEWSDQGAVSNSDLTAEHIADVPSQETGDEPNRENGSISQVGPSAICWDEQRDKPASNVESGTSTRNQSQTRCIEFGLRSGEELDYQDAPARARVESAYVGTFGADTRQLGHGPTNQDLEFGTQSESSKTSALADLRSHEEVLETVTRQQQLLLRPSRRLKL